MHSSSCVAGRHSLDYVHCNRKLPNMQVTFLQRQRPPHQPGILVLHVREEDKWVMVGVHRHWKLCCVHINIKVLQCNDEREGLLLDGGVQRLMFVELL